MKIYTKTGDFGETSLIGGCRVKKNCDEIKAIGDVDELNAAIGIIIADLTAEQYGETIRMLTGTQKHLFVIGARVANAKINTNRTPELKSDDIVFLEKWIDAMDSELTELKNFILPSGNPVAARIFFTRAVCRRAERSVVAISESYPSFDPLIQQYLNRLSDALFVLGRFVNLKSGISETLWKK